MDKDFSREVWQECAYDLAKAVKKDYLKETDAPDAPTYFTRKLQEPALKFYATIDDYQYAMEFLAAYGHEQTAKDQIVSLAEKHFHQMAKEIFLQEIVKITKIKPGKK